MVIDKIKTLIDDSESEDNRSSSPVQRSGNDRKKRRGIIEKRRRDRINNSLSDLKRLVPSAYEKQGSAKLEKAEILQMTVDHLKNLAQKGYGYSDSSNNFEYRMIGFRECIAEVARYLVTVEGLDVHDPLRVRLLSHLQYASHQREAESKSRVMGSHAHSAHSLYSHQWPTTPLPCAPNAGTSTYSLGGVRGSSGPGFHSSSNSGSPAEVLFHQPSPYNPNMVPSSSTAPSITPTTESSNLLTAASSFRQPGGEHMANILPSNPFSSISGIGQSPNSSYPGYGSQNTTHSSLFSGNQQMDLKPYRPWGTELGAY